LKRALNELDLGMRSDLEESPSTGSGGRVLTSHQESNPERREGGKERKRFSFGV